MIPASGTLIFLDGDEKEHGLNGLNGNGRIFLGMDGPLKRKGMGTDFLEGTQNPASGSLILVI